MKKKTHGQRIAHKLKTVLKSPITIDVLGTPEPDWESLYKQSMETNAELQSLVDIMALKLRAIRAVLDQITEDKS